MHGRLCRRCYSHLEFKTRVCFAFVSPLSPLSPSTQRFALSLVQSLCKMKSLDIERLCQNMAKMTVLDRSREKDVEMPQVDLVCEFERIAINIGGWSYYTNAETLNARMVTLFGAVPISIAKIWELMEEHNGMESWPKGVTKDHLFWALHKLKSYSDESEMCVTIKGNGKPPDEKTFRKWSEFMISELSYLEAFVILWENRKYNDGGDDAEELIFAGVDTFDSPFQQIKIPDPENPGKKIVNKALYSFKLKGPGLRYEVATAIHSNDIVWIAGPYPPGDYKSAHCTVCTITLNKLNSTSTGLI